MLNYIPIFGWILDFIFKVSLAVPFWFIWTVSDIGGEYFYFLPDKFQKIDFWPTVGIFVCLGILKSFSPFVVSSSSTNENKKQ